MGSKGDEAPDRPAAPPENRRVARGVATAALGAMVVVALVAVVALVWDLTHDARTGPDPTVDSADSCGGGVPSAVLAFDTRTGEQRWSALAGRSTGMTLGAEAVVVDDREDFRALSLTDGAARWCEGLDPRAVHDIRPLRSGGGLVYVEPDRLVLRDGIDGAERWSVPGEFELVATDERVVLVADLETNDGARKMFRGIELATGDERWSFERPPASELDEYPPSIATDEAGRSVVFDGNGTTSVGPDGVAWTRDLFRPVGQRGGQLLGGALVDYPVTKFGLESLDATTGESTWSREVPGADGVLVGDVVVVLEQNGPPGEPGSDPSAATSTARGYDASTGEPLWDQLLPASRSMVATPDRVMLAGTGQISAVDARTGREVWTHELDNPARTEHFDRGDLILAESTDPDTGTVFLLVQAQAPYSD